MSNPNASGPAKPGPADEVDSTPPGMEDLTALPVVTAILASAISVAEERASSGDVVHGVLAALRHLRHTADEEAGYAMASAIDTSVRNSLLVSGMSERRRIGHEPITAPLPPAGPGASIASIIMESAADSCLAVNAHAPDNEPLEIAVNALAMQIGSHLNGLPAWDDVEREMRRPAERHGPGPAAILPIGGATIH